MKKILFSPFSNSLPNGKPNPKSYPIDYCNELVEMLNKIYPVHHVKLSSEPSIENTVQIVDNSLRNLVELIKSKETALWISVDNFFHHLSNYAKRPGFVVFSRSNPFIFGHDKNINLIRSFKAMRPDPFGYWWNCEYLKEAFLTPSEIMQNINENRGKIWD